MVEYVRLLTRETRPPVPRNEIAVITPYHKMAMKIEDGLRASGLSGVLVGSTERLQGQERRVVIISTVRSNPDHLAFDTKHLLGFVGNPKRFNVAITRAMALLIVVGNPDILSRDPNWHALLHRCAKKGSWVGEGMRQAIDAPPPRAASAGGDCALSNGFAALSLGNSGNGPEETGEEDGNPSHQMEEGRSWQRDE